MRIGQKHSEATKQKMREARKKRKSPGFSGHKHTKESKRRMSEALKKIPHTKEWNNKMAASLEGKKKSKEHCENLSKALKGKKLTGKRKKGIGDFFRGKKLSEEHKRKIGKGNALAIKEGRSKVGRKSIQGDYYSEKNKKKLHYRSLLEKEWYMIFEKTTIIKRYYVEPVMIPYEFEGKSRHYIPDIGVKYNNGREQLIEVKPETWWEHPLNIAKWKAAKKWCKARKTQTAFHVVGKGVV